MATRTIQIESTTLDELVNKITTEVTQKLDDEKKRRDAKHDPRFISPLEVAQIFDVSVTTVYNWESKGIITGYRIGGRKRYQKDEILKAATVAKPGE